MQTEVSLDERHERLENLQARHVSLSNIKDKVRKLNVALANLALSDRKNQLGLIKAATRYVAEIESPPVGVKPLLATVHNELMSMREGILADAVLPQDLLLLSGVRAVKGIDEILAKVALNITKVQAGIGDINHDPNAALIKKNQAAKEKIPKFEGKAYVFGRAPVAFTFVSKQKAGVGYLDKESLDRTGFKSDNLGGYTILHKQLVMGIDSHAIYDTVTDADGKEKKVRQRVKESAIVFKAGKPTKVIKARDKIPMDVAKNYKKLLEQKTNTRYAFVSEWSVGLNGGEFFWLLPVADAKRLAAAFPGGHIKVSKWGFAF